jgi:hypothetical protein
MDLKQHDDHVWMSINGVGWAIHGIARRHDLMLVSLWRGYEPNIETCTIKLTLDWQQEYSDMAHRMLEDHFELDPLRG